MLRRLLYSLVFSSSMFVFVGCVVVVCGVVNGFVVGVIVGVVGGGVGVIESHSFRWVCAIFSSSGVISSSRSNISFMYWNALGFSSSRAYFSSSLWIGRSKKKFVDCSPSSLFSVFSSSRFPWWAYRSIVGCFVRYVFSWFFLLFMFSTVVTSMRVFPRGIVSPSVMS